MFKYILKRIGYSILVLIGVSLIIYFLTRLMPIDFVEKKISNITTNVVTEVLIVLTKVEFKDELMLSAKGRFGYNTLFSRIRSKITTVSLIE